MVKGHVTPPVFLVQGYLGLVVLGSLQYGGAPCSSEDEAAQSAAAMANINLKPVRTS